MSISYFEHNLLVKVLVVEYVCILKIEMIIKPKINIKLYLSKYSVIQDYPLQIVFFLLLD